MTPSIIIPEIGLTAQSTVSSLQYARLIQDAILCNRDTLKRYFGDFGLIYKPKNILSGDMYFAFRRGTKKYLAVIDCTGHGISAALLTILGHNMLERAIKKKDSLSDIMFYFNEKIIESFNHNELALGMDLVMICKDESSNKITYCGARRPLLLLRKNGSIFRFKTDRVSIGEKEQYRWTSDAFEAEEGDRIFLFSDGIVDQFGERCLRKYGHNRLKNFLTKHILTDMKELASKLEFDLIDHQGAMHQIDDMLFLGVSL